MIRVEKIHVTFEGDTIEVMDEIFNLVSALGCMCREKDISDYDMIKRIVEAYTYYDSIDDMERQKKEQKKILDEVYSLIK